MMGIRFVVSATLVFLGLGLAGCGQAAKDAPPSVKPETTSSAGHTHDSWWCDEHGVPEEVCALCNSKVAASLKAAGDWCSEHERPDSQCFVCHPEKQAEFAAQYEAKYGKQPPKPKAEEHEPGHDEDAHDHKS